MEGTLAARVLVRVVDLVARKGHDAEELCRSVGLTLAALRDPEMRVPYTVAEELGERAAAITRDANFGLHLALEMGDAKGFDAGMLMLMASPTVRVALERMAHHQRYWGDGERSTLVPARGGMRVQYTLRGSTSRHTDECMMAELTVGLRFLTGREVSARTVRFRHAAPRDLREHEALFRCPLEFGARVTEMVLDDATLDLQLANANAIYFEVFRAQVEKALARLPVKRGLATEARAAARAALTGGDCTLGGTAKMLGISPRTMQRRLHREGTSFAALVDALRRELAMEYLEKGVALQEIAWHLGYADVTAFHHAFRRWTGKSPASARQSTASARQPGTRAR
jgi:AraC-like DNA-binding protein